ncbi:hypothetical protein DSO57_1031575 [Entomophthora muscae]|uniref:Uncharacterized protein n=1 Tax=Entomophthora muscae TaxID=34485 RepID=A0ACC2RFD0_9FUNG|nr:hypothetical protein DSO57_1031575 [Entomophthora muscae]
MLEYKNEMWKETGQQKIHCFLQNGINPSVFHGGFRLLTVQYITVQSPDFQAKLGLWAQIPVSQLILLFRAP